MGEIADMMLDGTMCSRCGEFLHDGADGDGFPQLCGSCRREDRAERAAPKSARLMVPRTIPCGAGCNKMFYTEEGARDHRRDKHGITP
ncbi:MAG: hypothetical protein KGL35_13225 [Bradyrhizobium sp.]|nr:hypothetical protein [Bradyrhizobium sp.]